MSESEYPFSVSKGALGETETRKFDAEETPKPLRRTYKRKPDVAALMREAGITWSTHEGRRILNIPSKATPEQVQAVYDALR